MFKKPLVHIQSQKYQSLFTVKTAMKEKIKQQKKTNKGSKLTQQVIL